MFNRLPEKFIKGRKPSWADIERTPSVKFFTPWQFVVDMDGNFYFIGQFDGDRRPGGTVHIGLRRSVLSGKLTAYIPEDTYERWEPVREVAARAQQCDVVITGPTDYAVNHRSRDE